MVSLPMKLVCSELSQKKKDVFFHMLKSTSEVSGFRGLIPVLKNQTLRTITLLTILFGI